MTSTGIKSMRLYAHLERIARELEAAGIDPDGVLTVDQLSPFDNLHYHGTDAMDRAILELGVNADSNIAEIGSGLGGPARYIADRTGCRVTALELQPDLDAVAQKLTEQCGLAQLVTHRCGDVMDGPLETGAYDAVVSWLALYHIADPAALFAHIAAALKPSGGLYVEDLFGRGDFTADETVLVRDKLYGQSLPRLNVYGAHLADAGLTDIRLDDLSDDWAGFTRQRNIAYRADRERHVALHGEETVTELAAFYDTVDQLFQGGNLGGVRAVARLA
ncbi:MAG: methyltransferase domain-containing protein [Pseudomonadota bacterium]